jgi:hypothetical protein
VGSDSEDRLALGHPGLYYPLADFPDQRWLKLALLNWDQIQRIRPAGYQELDLVSGRHSRP